MTGVNAITFQEKTEAGQVSVDHLPEEELVQVSVVTYIDSESGAKLERWLSFPIPEAAQLVQKLLFIPEVRQAMVHGLWMPGTPPMFLPEGQRLYALRHAMDDDTGLNLDKVETLSGIPAARLVLAEQGFIQLTDEEVDKLAAGYGSSRGWIRNGRPS